MGSKQEVKKEKPKQKKEAKKSTEAKRGRIIKNKTFTRRVDREAS